LDKEIGKGSFAVVYRAVSKKNDSPVAVKLITRENLNKVDEDYIRSEAEILLELNHPNIIKCLKFYEEPDKFYMVLEIVTGGELFDRIVKKSYYTEKEARDLVEILLSTINHCHERDIVHRSVE
jgi:serine/threonine protein kinase